MHSSRSRFCLGLGGVPCDRPIGPGVILHEQRHCPRLPRRKRHHREILPGEEATRLVLAAKDALRRLDAEMRRHRVATEAIAERVVHAVMDAGAWKIIPGRGAAPGPGMADPDALELREEEQHLAMEIARELAQRGRAAPGASAEEQPLAVGP